MQLPRLYLAWVTPQAFSPAVAALDAVDGDEIRIGTVRVQFRAAGRESTVTATSG